MQGVLYCGIDFHKNTCTYCIMRSDGQEVEPPTRCVTGNLVKLLAVKGPLKIGIEASGGTNDMVQKLKTSGHDVRIINPNKFKAIGIGGKKTDERDARALAEALRLNYIPEVHHKTLYSRSLKSLLVSREQLVRARVNFINHIRGTLREYGITMPKGVEAYEDSIGASLRCVENAHILDALIFMNQEVVRLMDKEKGVEKAIEDFTEPDERIELLMTIPGVGKLGARAIVCVIDDIERFKDGKHFASYLGLVPREHSSGDERRVGSITRSGSEIVRRYLIHGARAVLRATREDTKDPMRKWALKLQAKVGQNKATVALAHRLARIAFSVLKHKRPYLEAGPQRRKAQTAEKVA